MKRLDVGIFNMSRRWLRTLDAAEHLKLKPATLISYRHRKIGPRYSKLGSVVVCDLSDLDRWVDECAVHPGVKNSSEMEAA